ncbi:hypothetical protein NFI96_032899, partial [Prochilodus magdalenae]
VLTVATLRTNALTLSVISKPAGESSTAERGCAEGQASSHDKRRNRQQTVEANRTRQLTTHKLYILRMFFCLGLKRDETWAGLTRLNSDSMAILSVRSSHRRRYVALLLSITGVIIYRHFSGHSGRTRISRSEGLNVNSSQFTLGGESFRLIGGSLHYFRVPRAYWRDRMMKMKACGINTLTTYVSVPWNLHQPERKVFQFHGSLDLDGVVPDCHGVTQNGSGSSSVTSPALVLVETPNEPVCGDIVVSTKMSGLSSHVQKAWCPSTSTPTAPSAGTVLFLLQAVDVGLWVILRPGPYVGSELDLGGLPSWLLRDRMMKLRTTYAGFTEAVNAFFDKLIPKVVPLQFKKGGPVIAVQVESEYGSFAKDRDYIPFLKEALQSRGISELLLTAERHEGLEVGGVGGVHRTLNLRKLNYDDIKYLEAVQPNSPMLVMEYWTGWFDGWGDLHHSFPAE